MTISAQRTVSTRVSTWLHRVSVALIAIGMAASVQATEVALLDQNYVLFNSDAAQDATAELKREFEQEEQQVQTLGQSIQQLQSRARTDADIMTEAEMAELESQLQQRARQREQLVRQLQQVQAERRNAFIEQYQPMMAQAIEAAVEGNEFDVILDKAAVVYHRNSLDITEAVLEEFNALYQAQQ
ncbi:MAG TPA: OmpH family outer membrane protein [Saccharospirillum sp.]|nr:OmpH family outer membrane protein [Saccharospirillum sp.]